MVQLRENLSISAVAPHLLSLKKLRVIPRILDFPYFPLLHLFYYPENKWGTIEKSCSWGWVKIGKLDALILAKYRVDERLFLKAQIWPGLYWRGCLLVQLQIWLKYCGPCQISLRLGTEVQQAWGRTALSFMLYSKCPRLDWEETKQALAILWVGEAGCLHWLRPANWGHLSTPPSSQAAPLQAVLAGCRGRWGGA